MPPKRIRVIKPPTDAEEVGKTEPEPTITTIHTSTSNDDPNAPLIIHLADLHIRCGTLATSRYDEYNAVFNRIVVLVEKLSTQDTTKNRPIYIVIAGDLFHSKLKIESPGLKLALQFLSGLGALAPVYVIAGNHDISQTNPDEPDLIHVLVNSGLLGPRVKYLDKTGYHRVDDTLGIGLVTIQDALQRGGTSGRATELPDFPPIPTERAPYNIALFHGAVTGALLANNETMSSEADTYPTSWITAGGYKYVLLGDIHLTDVKGGQTALKSNAPVQLPDATHIASHTPITPGTPMIAYSGSPVQQNHGEPLIGHGLLLWDLNPGKPIVHQYHVTNEYGFITLDVDNMKVKFAHKDWRPLDDPVTMATMPNKLNVRIWTTTDSNHHHNLNDLKNLFASYGKEVVQVSRIECPKTDVNDDDSAQKSPEENMAKLAEFGADVAEEPLTAMNTPVAWHAFVSASTATSGSSNSETSKEVPLEWFTNPDSLSLPTQTDEPGLTTLVTTRNAKIDKKVREYMGVVGQQSTAHGSAAFRLRHMEWDWILCYKAGNYFSFDSLSADKLIAISARNGMGKTSFLETICLALWGEGFPSRKTSGKLGDVVCAHMPSDATPVTTVYLDVRTTPTTTHTYRVRRNFAPTATAAQAAQVERVTVNPTTNIVTVDDATVAVGRPATTQWLAATIGPMEPFLMSSMITQNSDMDFFALKPQEQREMLDRALNIDTSTAYHAVVKEAKLAHSAATDALKVLIDSMQYTSKCPISPEDVVRLEEEHDALTTATATLTAQVDTLRAELATLPTVKMTTTTTTTSDPLTPEDVTQYQTMKAEFKALKVDAFLDNYEKPDPSDLEEMELSDPAPMTLEAIERELNTPALATLGDDVDEDAKPDEIEAARTEREHLLANPVHKPLVLSANSDADLLIQVPDALDGPEPPIPDITRIAYQDYMSHYAQYKQFAPLSTNGDGDEGDDEPDRTLLPSMLREMATLKAVEAIEPKSSSGQAHSWLWQGDGDAPVNHHCDICRSRVQKPISPTLKKAHRKWELQRKIAALVTHDIAYYEEQYELIQQREAYEKREQERQEAQTKLQRAQDTAKWREYQAKLAEVNEVLKQAARVQARARKAELEEWQEQETTRRLVLAWRLQDQIFALETKIASARARITAELAKLEADLALKAQEHRRIGLELHDARRIQREHAAQTAQYASRTALLASLQDRSALISHTFEAFANFKTWLYTHKVLPHIGRVANRIMQVMCEDRPLVLIGDATTTTNGGLAWYLQDGQVKAPIEKASGFQRFIAGIAIRLALGRLMQNAADCSQQTQLFVDEGFVACDQENRARVGQFLKALPHSQIFLVSHLEDVNQCAQRHVNIERPPFEQQSLLQVGRAVRSLMVANSAPPDKKKRIKT